MPTSSREDFVNGLLEQPERFERGVGAAPDDDVVVERNAEASRGGGHLLGHRDILRTGGGIAARMVVTMIRAVAPTASARLTTSRGYTGAWLTVPVC